MAKGSIRLAAVLLTLTLPGAPVGAQSAPKLHVRAYNAFGIASSDIRHALRTADSILRAAGLVAAWRECRTPAGPSAGLADRCEDTISHSEMILRIVASPSSAKAPVFQTLGVSHVDLDLRAGTLATVYADRVRATAVRARVDPGVLIGRVAAHEIGHLLLGTQEHADDGLMRAHWPEPVLQATMPRDWMFSQAEAARLLAAARERVAAPRVLAFRPFSFLRPESALR